MRVLLVVGMVAGGAGRHVRDLAGGLAGRGHQVGVVCPQSVADRYELGAPSGRPGAEVQVTVAQIAERPHPATDARTMRTLRRRAGEVDVVHAHGLRAGAMAVLASRSTPVVVTLHNAPPEHGAARVVFHALEKVIATRAAVVLGVSDDLVARMRGLGARDTRLAVVPTSRLRRPSRPAPLVRADLGVADRMALAVGRLAPQKRVDLIVEAAAALHQSLPGLGWYVAGDGPLRDALQHQIAALDAPVTLLGQRPDVPDLLRATDVAVSTAVWEGQPVWLQEALVCGAPVVASDVGGTAAVLGDAGVLVPFADQAALVGAVRSVVTSPAYGQELRERSRERAARLPTLQEAVDHAERVYARVLGSAMA